MRRRLLFLPIPSLSQLILSIFLLLAITTDNNIYVAATGGGKKPPSKNAILLSDVCPLPPFTSLDLTIHLTTY